MGKNFFGRKDYFEKLDALVLQNHAERKVWQIYGIGGIGKSWLLHEMEDRLKARDIPTAYFDLEGCTATEDFYLSICCQLLEQNSELFPGLLKHLKRYERVMNEREETGEFQPKRFTKRLLFNLNKLVPVWKDTVSDADEYTKEADDNFLQQIAKILWNALEDEVTELARKRNDVAILLDTFERASVIEEVAKDFIIRFQSQAILIVAGRQQLTKKHLTFKEKEHFSLNEHELETLVVDEIRDGLRAGAQTWESEQTQAQQLQNVSSGYPLIIGIVLDTLGKEGLQSIRGLDLNEENLEEQLLDFLTTEIFPALDEKEPETSRLLQITGIPRLIDADLFRQLDTVIAGETSETNIADRFESFKKFSFIHKRDSVFRCHPVMQDAVRRYLRKNNPEGLTQSDEICKNYFKNIGIEEIYHDYMLAPAEIFERLKHTFESLLEDNSNIPIADALLDDFISYCHKINIDNDQEKGNLILSIVNFLTNYPRGGLPSIVIKRIELLCNALLLFIGGRLRGHTLFKLGVAFSDLSVGSRNDNLKNAIKNYEGSLEILNKNDFPEDWALTQNRLGEAYRELPTGGREQNLQRAIDYCNSALEIFTKEHSQIQWATTQNNLGNVWADLPTGNQDQNQQRAIECYAKALEVRTKEQFPLQWAMTQNNLGIAWNNLPSGNRGKNLQMAIDCHTRALEVRTKEQFPMDWAMTQNNLAAALYELPIGDRNQNLNKAINHLRKALEVRTKELFPIDWAMVQNNLGAAYKELTTGEGELNLLKAISYFRKALEVRTKEHFPMGWATTQNNLGDAWNKLLSGDRKQNLQQAIQCYQNALIIWTEEAFPNDNKIAVNNLEIAQEKLWELQGK